MLWSRSGDKAIQSVTSFKERILSVAGCIALLAISSPLCATYDIRQIADESRYNADVSISDSGFVTWMAASTNSQESRVADVALYEDGNLRYLTGGNISNMYGNVKPEAVGSSIVWVGAFSSRYSDEAAEWILREVPNRDEGAPELRAHYSATEREGKQVLIPILVQTNTPDETIPDQPPSTNLPPETVKYEPQTFVPSDTGDGTMVTNEIRRHPSGVDEVCYWEVGGEPRRITANARHDFAPSHWGRLISWQIEKGFPFGWEIMAWDDGKFVQLTTNFYYDMAPKVYERQIVWYGWDGHDFEIFLHDRDKNQTVQITSNQFDDVSPVIWDGMIAWEGYPAAEADVYIWKPDTAPRKISDNIEDDFSPRIWDGKVVWQGFDGDDFEIYYFDGDKTVKLTSNLFDDTSPEIRDGLVVWAGNHDNWDAEIYVWPLEGDPQRLTENEYEDRDPRTAGKRIVWRQERDGIYSIYLASPK